jgi:hypothetical protein
LSRCLIISTLEYERYFSGSRLQRFGLPQLLGTHGCSQALAVLYWRLPRGHRDLLVGLAHTCFYYTPESS